MTVAEYLIQELLYGVERDLALSLMPEIRKSEKNLIAVCSCSVLRKVFLRLYKLQEPIENMEGKAEFKEYIIESFPGKSKKELVENAKIIYTVSKYL